MRNDALREYKFKLYLNANHFVIFNGKKGESHPHTWEFCIEVLVDKAKFIMFLDFEKAIDDYLEPYQDKLINDIKPFDTIIPTLENMLDYFAPKFYEEVAKVQETLEYTTTETYDLINLENAIKLEAAAAAASEAAAG